MNNMNKQIFGGLFLAVLVLVVTGCTTVPSGGVTYHYRNGQPLPAGADVVEYNRGVVTPIGATGSGFVVGPTQSQRIAPSPVVYNDQVVVQGASRGVPVYTYPDPQDQINLRRQDVYEDDHAHRRALDWARVRQQNEREAYRRQQEANRQALREQEQAVRSIQRLNDMRNDNVSRGTNIIPTRQEVRTNVRTWQQGREQAPPRQVRPSGHRSTSSGSTRSSSPMSYSPPKARPTRKVARPAVSRPAPSRQATSRRVPAPSSRKAAPASSRTHRGSTSARSVRGR